MKISFSEDGRNDGMPSQASEAGPAALVVSVEEKVRLANLERLQNYIDKAIAGSLPRERPLKDWEVQKLSPVHVQMAMERASGLQVTEVAELHNYTVPAVSTILNHPDAQFLIGTILSMSADKLTDMQARLKHLAPEALNVKVELMRTAKLEGIRDKAASDLLALAGYGGKAANININSNNKGPTLVLSAQAAAGLAGALKEANQVSSIDYSQFLSSKQDGVIAAEHRQLVGGQLATPGQGSSEGGASPTPSSDFDVEGSWETVREDLELAQAREDELESLREARVA